jgi:predicted phosphoribosyltransferase
MALYRDRHDAGEKLADALEDLRGTPNLLVLALPRGGVPVAEAVARRLGAPLVRHILASAGSSREVGAEGAP